MKAKLLSVQAGQVRKVLIQGRLVPSALRKVAQSGPVQLAALGLLADEQADLSVHGGLDKAVYAYPAEHYDFWRAARAEAGLDAIEVFHPDHDFNAVTHYRQRAQRLRLAVTGGSDFHGRDSGRVNAMGRVTLPPEEFARFAERLRP